MCSIIGRLTSGAIGLGWFDVSGRRRLPSPPAMMTAFIGIDPTPGSSRHPYPGPALAGSARRAAGR